MSAAEDELALHLSAAGIAFERELRFHPVRRWRFDFAIPGSGVAIEVDGGGFVGGRHGRGLGIEKDAEKFSEAAALGWRVIRVTPRQIRSGYALDVIERAIRGRCESQAI